MRAQQQHSSIRHLWLFLLRAGALVGGLLGFSHSAMAINTATAVTFIKSRHNASAPFNYVVSYNCPINVACVPGVSANAGYVYDNALAVNLLMHHASLGTAAANLNSRTRAETILLYMRNNWQQTNGGFFEAYVGPFPSTSNRPVGPAAWFAIAALNFVRAGGNGNAANTALIQTAAVSTLNWIQTQQAPAPVLGPAAVAYLWGYQSNPCTTPTGQLNVMSTEHHTAIYAAAVLGLAVTGNQTYATMAQNAKQFVLGMWQPFSNSVFIGTSCGNAGFNFLFFSDPYVLAVLSMQNNFLVPGDPQGDRWAASFPSLNTAGIGSAVVGTTTYAGYNFSAMGGGIHPETTGQARLAKLVTGDTTSPILATMDQALNAAQTLAVGTTPGAATGEGVVAAFTTGGVALPNPYGTYVSVPAVAATVWAYFADPTVSINPYYFLPASPQVVLFGQDALGFTATTPSGFLQLTVTGGTPGDLVWITVTAFDPLQPFLTTPIPAPVLYATGGVIANLPPLLSLPTFQIFPLGTFNAAGSFTVTVGLPFPPIGLTVYLQAVSVSPTNTTIHAISPQITQAL